LHPARLRLRGCMTGEARDRDGRGNGTFLQHGWCSLSDGFQVVSLGQTPVDLIQLPGERNSLQKFLFLRQSCSRQKQQEK